MFSQLIFVTAKKFRGCRICLIPRRPVMAEANKNNGNEFSEIIIIGAGMSGLSAANNLVKNGMTNFKVLEARNKIGGRIEVAVMGNHKIEMGANSIHGVLGNPMYEIASSHGLINITHMPKAHNVVAAMEDGQQVPFSILQEIYEAYICFLRRCEEYFICQYLPPTGISSVGEHICLEIALYLDKVADFKERQVKQLIFDCLLKRETCITGCNNMNEVDLLELGSYTELQGGNIVLPGGYSSILDPIASIIPAENFKLNHPVIAINWKNLGENLLGSGYDSGIDLLANGENFNDSDSDKTVIDEGFMPKINSSSVTTGCEKNGEKNSNCGLVNEGASDNMSDSCDVKNQNIVEVVCENGSKFYAHHVICTIPLGVLKEKASSLFHPKLPDQKLDSIKKLSFGIVDKIFLEYARPFLHEDVSEVMLLWSKENLEVEDLSQNWFKKIYSFSKVTDTLLLGWISGKEAVYMETLTNDEVGKKCTEILRKFLNDPYIPLPKVCTCSNWSNQEFFKGSYTSISVGASHSDIENIAQPLYSHPQQKKPVLLFAGEHTHRSFYSTVHGAYLTGRNAAQIILAPESEETELTCVETNDLSSWIQGISLQ